MLDAALAEMERDSTRVRSESTRVLDAALVEMKLAIDRAANSRGLGDPTGPLGTPSRPPLDPLQIRKVP